MIKQHLKTHWQMCQHLRHGSPTMFSVAKAWFMAKMRISSITPLELKAIGRVREMFNLNRNQ